MKLLAVVALVALAAGCAAPSAAPDPTSPPNAEPAEPTVTTYRLSGNVTLAFFSNVLMPDTSWEQWALLFNTTNATRLLVLTLSWQDSTGRQDLDAWLSTANPIPLSDDDLICTAPPTYDDCRGSYMDSDGAPGAPDNPSVIVLTEDTLSEVGSYCGRPCAWQAVPYGKAAYADVAWTMTAVVVDSPQPLPAGYVLPAAGS
jgi:hypothetical protein